MTAWPTAQDLFDQLANGQAPTDWASKIVRLIKNENGIEACVFQDRDDTSVRIAGPAPSKTHAIKKELAIRASGLDASGRFHTTLRFVFLNGTSIAVDQQLDQIAKDSVDILSSRIRKQSAPKAASEPQPNEVLPESACPARTTNTSASRCKEKASGVTRAAPSLKYGIFVAGPATQKVIVEIEQLAPNPYPVLILGPTGTGKERVAQAVHQASGRTGSRVSLNCAAFTSDLIGSELFGHVKGAFTGADKDREGVIQQADHGTLFLDEIGELNPKHQATLLRVLQEGSVRRIGSAKEEKVDVRVIAATNRPLQEMVASGAFREDLFYRLAGAAIEVLPLSDRRDEILP
ncbi:MAG: sigma 54-interacting transcriptional regulator, partial [Blastocatellia bacterium]